MWLPHINDTNFTSAQAQLHIMKWQQALSIAQSAKRTDDGSCAMSAASRWRTVCGAVA
jgi:hypothetical protein